MSNYEDIFNPSFLTRNNEREMPAGILSPFPKDASVTMAYISFQQEPVVFAEKSKALNTGTLFPELDKPFTGEGVLK